MSKKNETNMNTEATANTAAIAGKDVGVIPAGVAFVSANPTDDMATFVPGKNWSVGQNLSGRYVRTERVYSDKFTAGKKDVNGKIYRDLHVLEDMTNGALFGIWSVGILGNFFEQCPVESPVSITYLGLADKPLKPGQAVPHNFNMALGAGYRLQRKPNLGAAASSVHA